MFFLFLIVVFILIVVLICTSISKQKNLWDTTKKQNIVTQFDRTLSNIPQTKIVLSDKKIKKNPISDLSGFKFKNITKSTGFEQLKDFTVIDVETTGLQVSRCEIIEVSAIRFRNAEPVEALTTLLNSKKPIPPEATEINKITNDMIANKPYFNQILETLSKFIGNDNLVGHNLLFDLKFLYKNGYNFLSQKRNYYDTLELAKKTIKSKYVENYKLTTLTEYIGIQRETSHRALSDCLATGYLFINLAKTRTGENDDF